MVRLKDIAAQARVSVMTVSKALRDAKDVSAETKARIKSLAAQMHYVPDTSAQGLRSRTTKLLGLVIPATTNPVYARMVHALEEKAFELGYDLVIAHTLNKPEREDLVLRRMIARRVDGLFVSPVYRFEAHARVYDELAARKIPTVLLGPPAPFCKNFPGVEIEEQLASYEVTKHLIGLGHKKIAYFTGPPSAPWSHERFEGYRRALREAGIEPDDNLVFASGSTIEEGVNTALEMLNEGCRPTALQTVNDLVAIGAAETLIQQGLKIPENISVAGFGNILVSEHFRVPLTTVRQPKLRLGHAAMESMMALLHGEKVVTKRLVAELVVRQSTAKPMA